MSGLFLGFAHFLEIEAGQASSHKQKAAAPKAWSEERRAGRRADEAAARRAGSSKTLHGPCQSDFTSSFAPAASIAPAAPGVVAGRTLLSGARAARDVEMDGASGAGRGGDQGYADGGGGGAGGPSVHEEQEEDVREEDEEEEQELTQPQGYTHGEGGSAVWSVLAGGQSGAAGRALMLANKPPPLQGMPLSAHTTDGEGGGGGSGGAASTTDGRVSCKFEGCELDFYDRCGMQAHFKKKHTLLRCAVAVCRRECAGTDGLRE
jgi:hypothetical protein